MVDDDNKIEPVEDKDDDTAADLADEDVDDDEDEQELELSPVEQELLRSG